MADWEILGIDKTKDIDIIRDAYRCALMVTNPEDNAEKFMALRKEYEEALLWAENSDSEEIDNISDSPIGVWIAKVREIYENFEQRINEDNWNDILEDDVCVRLDYKIEARDVLLDFLVGNYNLPHKIWKMIDNVFDIVVQREELYDIFPKEYIDNAVISSIRYEDVLDYSLFNMYSLADYDEFISTYYYLVKAMKERNDAECERLFEMIEDMGDVHPYSKVEKVKYFIRKNNIEEALEIAEELYDEYPDDEQANYVMAEALFANKQIGAAKEIYEEIFRNNKDSYFARVGIADCLMKKQEYEKAKEIYVELHKDNPYDSHLKECVEVANKYIIEKYENEYNNNTCDEKKIIDLGWCYLQNNMVEDALSMAFKINKFNNAYDYYNLLGRCYLYLERYDEAKEAVTKWIDIIINLEDDHTEETAKKKGRLGYAYEILSHIYEISNNKKEAIQCINKALETCADNEEYMEIKARLLLEMKEYDECHNICNRILNINENSFMSRYIKGVIFYKQRKYVDAIDEFSESTRLYPYYLPAYLYKIKILFKYEEYDKIEEILDYLDNNLMDSDSLIFYKTKLNYHREVDDDEDCSTNVNFEKYRDIYSKIITNYNNKESDIFEIDAVYYEMASAYMKEDDYKNAIEYAVKAADINEDNINAIMCLAYAYENIQEYELAIEANKRILEINPTHFCANNKIAEIYEHFHEYEDAIEYHTKQLEINDSMYFYMSRGLAYLQLDKFEEARQDFLKAIDGNSDNPHPYNNIGASYQYEDQYEEALKYYKLAIEYIDNEPTPLPYRNMATVYMRMKDVNKAIECYKESIKRFNKAYDYEEMALVLFEAMRYKEAVEVYTKKCKYFDENKTENTIALYVWVGKCNLSLGAEKTALKYFLKAIDESKKANIKYTNAYVELAKFYQLSNNNEMVIKYYSEIENDNVLNAINYADYACALRNIGNNKKSEEMINRAFADAEAMDERNLCELTYKYYKLGYCYVVKGDYESAKMYFKKALSNRKCNTCDFPKCCESLGGMAFMFESMGNNPMAAAYYKEALGVAPSNIGYIYGYRRVTEKEDNT